MHMTVGVKQDSVFFSVVMKRKQERKSSPMLPTMQGLPIILYLVRSSDFMLTKMVVLLVWKFVLCLTLQTGRMRNSKGS